MATLDDLMLEGELRADLVRLLPNIHDLISQWRATVAGGNASIGPACTAGARSMLGRLRRIDDFATANSADFNVMLSNIGVTRPSLNTRITLLRDQLRIFRDAAKTNAVEINAALDALEAGIPARRSFLYLPLPTDW